MSKTKKILKILSKMGFVNDVDPFFRDGSVSELSWLGESVTINKENYFKVNVINDGNESTFMIAGLKQFLDLQTEISQRYPDRNRDDLTIKYLDKYFNFVQIDDSKDFEIFMRQHNDHKIYVTWVNENSTPVNEPVNSYDPLKDVWLWPALMLLLVVALIAVSLQIYEVFRGETICENRVDHWSGYKKIIKEFCQHHPSTEECQRIIVEFLSFMSFDSIIQTRI
ncbi:uncharacterized protein LOC119077781 [Bradysia coprophila]|uniref:uncharacterized protein LOC119077781 n=1 Tax=Bradysia coprophila TaxID=38358 RepID=UPI00187D94BC|nr:uncharacterized protein LOC119077781 [Bradysia coprophila]